MNLLGKAHLEACFEIYTIYTILHRSDIDFYRYSHDVYTSSVNLQIGVLFDYFCNFAANEAKSDNFRRRFMVPLPEFAGFRGM